MTISLDQIWRYPIKGIGAERLESVIVTKDRPLPLDRALAILETGGASEDGWRSCRNFLRGAKGPSLMAITARVENETLHLAHPGRPDIAIDMGSTNCDDLFDWLRPIYPQNRPTPAAVVKAPETGMADVPFASVSVMNLASLRAVSEKAGRKLDVRRFRGNLWLDGLAPWEEFDLVGKKLKIGSSVLNMAEPIARCRATEANPETGHRDTPTLQILDEGWGHTQFGINCVVATSGEISCGEEVIVL